MEKHLLGGDCLNVGCVPSKAVIRAGKVLGEIACGRLRHRRGRRRGGGFRRGRAAHAPGAPKSASTTRPDASDLGIDLYLGDGKFTGPDTFAVDGRTIRFKRALIATGSRPTRPTLPGLDEVGYLTNETVFELTTLPPRLAVIGASPIERGWARRFCASAAG
ncbi:MAG: FAD-dependent oxidoreductase [Caldilineaceae bacterium]